MVYQLKRQQNNKRPQAFWGSLIPSAISFVGGLITSSQQAKAQKRAIEEQQRLAQQQLNISNQNQLASTLNNYASAEASYDDKDYNLKYRIGGTKRLGSNNIAITDGGSAKKIGSNTFFLRGGSHEDVNETGQTGIGINVGGNEIEAEGGEVAQKKGNSLRIYSAQPILGGISPAQAVMRGYNKDKVFNAQQRFKKNNGLKDDGSKARVGGSYGADYPSPLSLLSIIYDKTLGAFDDKNPNLITGIAPTPSRNLNLKQVRNGLITKSMLPTNRVYRITNMREVQDAKNFGQYRKLPENITIPTKTVKSNSGRSFTLGKAGGNSHGGKAASMGEPWTGTTSAGIGDSKYIISTPARHTTWQVGHHGRYSKPLPADAIKKGSGVWKKFDDNGNTGISTKRMTAYKDLGNGMYLRLNKSKYRLGGGLTSKDRGSSKHYYPSVASNDFAGGNRTYPIPTKTDAIDALRFAGLHGRSDVRAKVYSKYPSLRKKASIGTWARSNRDNNLLASVLYESGLTDINAWREMLRDIHTFTGMGADPYNDNSANEAVMTPAFGTSSTRQFANLAKTPEASYTLKQVLGLPNRQMIRKRIAGDISKRIGESRAAKELSRIRNYNTAKMQAANAEASFSPLGNQARYATGQPILVDTKGYYTTAGKTIERSAKNMTNGANPFLYTPRSSSQIRTGLNRAFESAKQRVRNVGQKVTNPNTYRTYNGSKLRYDPTTGLYEATPTYKLKPWVKAAAGTAGVGVGAGLIYGLSQVKNKDNKTKAQLDANGQPISQHIARPQEPTKQQPKTQDKKSVPVRRDTARTDTTKQANKVVPRQVKNAPQYTGNVTKGNYQLHDGETKTINGVKYTRRGNTIINHKTNVGYVYDKNGNYTGQADYSKVGNFNQAFDAARAAGRSNFIYRAGKYQNYSTAKETDAKKEAINRRVGARRIAKRVGGLTNPPVERFKCGGSSRPKAVLGTQNGFTGSGDLYSNRRKGLYDYSYVYPTYNEMSGTIPEVTVTASKPKSINTTPYIGRQSSFTPTTQDYIGLGIDTVAALSGSLFNRNAYKNLNFNYALPDYVDESAVAFDTTYHNEAQRANVERNRINSRNLISGNTASAQDALNRMQQTDTDAMMETNKLLDEKSNKEVELRNQNLANEQQVRARNAAAKNQYYQNVASIKNAAIQAKNEAELSRAKQLSVDLSGLSQAWTNFAGSVENRYNTRQNEAIIAATAKDPAVLSNAVQFGYQFSPEVLAGIYNSTNDDALKALALGQLSNKNRRKYGIK